MNVILPIPRLLVVPGATVSRNTFFVLGGIPITALLLNERARAGTVRVATFYGRRGVRLLSARYVVVSALAVFAAVNRSWAPTAGASICSVTDCYSNYYLASANHVCATSTPDGTTSCASPWPPASPWR
jgi:peptidoglycan/LPS O-acetylase OafA/YrhL